MLIQIIQVRKKIQLTLYTVYNHETQIIQIQIIMQISNNNNNHTSFPNDLLSDIEALKKEINNNN